jgi:hypothetical protein
VHQWGLFENVITLLSPFEQLTREVNSSEASAADVIPSVRALRRLFNKAADTDHGVKRGTRASQQLDGFFAEAPIPRNETALGYWRNNHLRFLAQMARKYPCAPCTSTDSERLFSSAAHILDEKRNRLSCNKAEMLIFAKKNCNSAAKRLQSDKLGTDVRQGKELHPTMVVSLGAHWQKDSCRSRCEA